MRINTSSADTSNQRMIVVDDHPVFRDGIAIILQKLAPEATIEHAGTYDGLMQAIDRGIGLRLIMLDLRFPGMDLQSALPELRRKCPSASIIVISTTDDRRAIDQVIKAGVDGFISKAASEGQILDGVSSVLRGEFVNISEAGGLIEGASESEFSTLTPRQMDVLHGIAQGKSNKQIAIDLGISPFTVRIHVSALMRELGVENRSAAAALATKYGIY